MISRASMQGSLYELTAKTSSTENFSCKDCLQSLLTKLILGKTAIVDPISLVNSSTKRSCVLKKIPASALISLGVWQSTVFLRFLQSIHRASITACCAFTLILILSKIKQLRETNLIKMGNPLKRRDHNDTNKQTQSNQTEIKTSSKHNKPKERKGIHWSVESIQIQFSKRSSLKNKQWRNRSKPSEIPTSNFVKHRQNDKKVPTFKSNQNQPKNHETRESHSEKSTTQWSQGKPRVVSLRKPLKRGDWITNQGTTEAWWLERDYDYRLPAHEGLNRDSLEPKWPRRQRDQKERSGTMKDKANPQTTTNTNHQSLTNRVKDETSSGSHGKLQSLALTTFSAGNSQRPMQCVVTL